MKINNLNRISVLLLVAFLNVVSGMAFSYPSEGLDLNSRNFDYLQADQNKKAVFFEEASISSSYEQESSNELPSFGRISEFQFSPDTLIKHFGQTTSWAYLRDSRQLLSQHIFPFQFFW